MKKIFILLTFVLVNHLSGQKVLGVPVDKFVSLHFPGKIEFKRVSIDPNTILVVEEGKDLFLQFLTDDIPEGNLLVKTIDGNFYSFILRYEKNPDPSLLNHFLEEENSLNYIKSNELQNNIPTSNIDKIESSKEKKNISPKKATIENIADYVKEKSGYIKSRNVSKNNGVESLLRGIYINNNKLYFLFRFKNRTQIPYDVLSWKYTLINKKKVSKTSFQEIDKFPIYTENAFYSMGGKKEEVVVLVFDKFTMDEDKLFKIDLLEKNGDRDLKIIIEGDQIEQAVVIKNKDIK